MPGMGNSLVVNPVSNLLVSRRLGRRRAVGGRSHFPIARLPARFIPDIGNANKIAGARPPPRPIGGKSAGAIRRFLLLHPSTASAMVFSRFTQMKLRHCNAAQSPAKAIQNSQSARRRIAPWLITLGRQGLRLPAAGTD